jgi:hypothetical protein
MACLLYRAQINLFYSGFFCQGMANDAVRFIYGEVFNESILPADSKRISFGTTLAANRASAQEFWLAAVAAEKFNQDEERTY